MHKHRMKVVFLFLLPNFLGFLIFVAGPVLVSLAAGFTNWNLQNPNSVRFVGLENFTKMFSDEEFWLYLFNTGYLMLGMPMQSGDLCFVPSYSTEKSGL